VSAAAGAAPVGGRAARPRIRTGGRRWNTPGLPRAGVTMLRAARTIGRASGRMLRAHASLRRALATEAVGRGESGAGVRARAFGLSRLAADMCSIHRCRLALSGPVPQGPVVLVANHLSYIDPLVLASIVPCVPLAKSEVSRWPLVGSLGRTHGVVFVRRGDPQSGALSLLAARRALLAGVSVLNFPEGTTTHGEAVLPFRRGVFGLARRTGVAVVPIALGFDEDDLCWTGGDLFLPHYLRATARAAIVVRVRFGHAMRPERYGSSAGLAAEARSVVAHLLGVAA
jgi:lyso-ornithine lipid O-acyltransferase